MAAISRTTPRIDLDTPGAQAEIDKIAGEIRAAASNPGAMAVEGLRQVFGGNAGIAREMGLVRGTKEYNSMLRSLQRESTAAGQKRGIGAVMQQRLHAITPSNRGDIHAGIRKGGKGAAAGKMPSKGKMSTRFHGSPGKPSVIRVSDDEREREIPEQFEEDPDAFDRLLEDPTGHMAEAYGMPGFTGSGHVTITYMSEEDF